MEQVYSKNNNVSNNCKMKKERQIVLHIFLWRGSVVSWVTQMPPTSEVCNSNPGPYGGMLVVVCHCLAIYRIESWSTSMYGFSLPLIQPIVI